MTSLPRRLAKSLVVGRPVTLALLLAASSPVATAASPLDKAWSGIAHPSPDLGSRSIIGFILEAAGGPDYAQRQAEIDTALQRLARMQNHDPTSKSYGNFCWYWHEQKPGDLNAVEFIVQQAALLKLRYADRLSPASAKTLDDLLQLAVEGIHRQKVDVGYTNIFLMKTWNLLALGEALHRPDLTQEGAAMLDQWIAFTSQNGIREFLSPTYYGIDLYSLGLINRQLTDPAIHAKSEASLRLFWTNIAANWFDPTGRLGGAHGRDYDYLTGHGELDPLLMEAGWISGAAARPGVNDIFLEATRWQPPAQLLQQARTALPRFVYQKWDAPDNTWASQYVGRHFSLGVSGASQGPEDKPFALNLAGATGPKMVMVNFFMDGRGDGYGKIKVATGASGHRKAHHLSPFFGAVQNGPEVLFLASWFAHTPLPAAKDPTPVCLQSHLDVPIEATVWTQDRPTDPDQPSQPLPGNVCFLRLDDVDVGLRFVLARDTTGRDVIAQVVNDGRAYAARRISIVHSAGPPGSGQGIVAVFVRAQEGLDDAAFARFRRDFLAAKTSASFGDGVATVSATGLKSELELKADTRHGTMLQSSGADPARQTPPMSVDGRDYATAILHQNAPAGF